MQCQHETLSPKSVVFFVWKPLKYYEALSLSTLYEEVLLTKSTKYTTSTTNYIYIYMYIYGYMYEYIYIYIYIYIYDIHCFAKVFRFKI